MLLFKELSFNSFYFGRVWLSSKNSVLTVSTLVRCSGLERTEFLTVSNLGGCAGLQRTDF